MNKSLMALVLLVSTTSVMAKLPPLSDDAKAKADEAKAKAAHTAKVEAYDLCKSQDKVAAHVQKHNKAQAGKPVATPPCADPGKFVYPPPVAAVVSTAPTPAAAAKVPAKK